MEQYWGCGVGPEIVEYHRRVAVWRGECHLVVWWMGQGAAADKYGSMDRTATPACPFVW